MRIKRGQHAVDGALDQLLLVGLGDVLRADPLEDVTKDAELLIGRCTGCIGGARIANTRHQRDDGSRADQSACD